MIVQGDGATPLHTACKNGHVEVVKALLQGGASVNGGHLVSLMYDFHGPLSTPPSPSSTSPSPPQFHVP
jgi:ankyrin repeat protein